MAADGGGATDIVEAQGRRWVVDAGMVSELRSHPAVAAALAEGSDGGWCDDRCLRRYLRGNIYNKPKDKRDQIVKSAAEQLAATLVWRGTGPQSLLAEGGKRPPDVRCSGCTADPTSHAMRIVGLDKTRRAVCYTCYSQSVHRFNVKENMEHMLWVMEEAAAVMERSGAGAEQWVWVVDFDGYSLWKDSNPGSGKELVKLIQHYPERLGVCVLVDAPTAFRGLWRILRPLLNDHTAEKVQFVSVGDFERECGAWAGRALGRWLANEIADNRRRRPPEKLYWVPSTSGHESRADPRFVHSHLFRLPPWCPGYADFAPAPAQREEEGGAALPPPAFITDDDADAELEELAVDPPQESGGGGGGCTAALLCVLWVCVCCTGGAGVGEYTDGSLGWYAVAVGASFVCTALLSRCCCVSAGGVSGAVMAAAGRGSAQLRCGSGAAQRLVARVSAVGSSARDRRD
eukprot:TRINITY_DN7183_c0_g1_i1.p1 TRINITY_DN7183_c0_g1~~TRINITY_DN7183_c0_g1_i1.p1  ORF type:complete len:483 (+),score=152.46 TRINITY_DN7183_c0_g1_i1:73-1449(+)